MANITRIKAKDNAPKEVEKPKKVEEPKKQASQKDAPSKPKTAEKPAKTKKPMALLVITWPFRMLAKPFIALGKYIKASWHEIRQVRWPSRGATWKMTFAALIYTGVFIALIMLLDALFTWVFNALLS